MYLHSILFRHGDGNFELWQLDLPEEARTKVMAILEEYSRTGCSVRGSRKDIVKELLDI